VQKQVLDLLLDLQRRYGISYLFISHDLKVIRAMAHRIVVMRVVASLKRVAPSSCLISRRIATPRRCCVPHCLPIMSAVIHSPIESPTGEVLLTVYRLASAYRRQCIPSMG